MVLDSVDTIPAGTPVFRISRDEDPSARAKTRKLVLKESRMAYVDCSSWNLACNLAVFQLLPNASNAGATLH
jgi:hypothetical protein